MVYFPLFIVGLLMLFFCNYKVEQHAIGKTYFDTDKIPFNKIGLLLGTCKTLKDKKTINPFWQYRLQATYALWKAKKINKILISGDNGWHGYNEPQDFMDALIALGVPDSCLVPDYAGFRTHDSVIRCKQIFSQQKVTIISQQFHNERALMIANAYGLEAIGFNAKDVNFKEGLYNIFRESAARVLLFLDLYVLHTEPHFLGKKISIH